ncbi:hypothetical protein [Pseudacidobacterium ailaaui]|jgi:hypothetical protein|uniref:hypothetical protein n=1 Tax=Pseudacidobacterium ailaaui TaxID=1382359 RepID=UPI00047C9D35|nr:hypothetical protein [Pseudacidobacterium ailaaui]MBX6361757.1 hypothetical protein [Pseudacidobacterium ailaaui]MCL6464741.1 hypothetical protein [Pseudacidobacterium ailaaui]MDI3256053.1 hypothetical protein [Bacillota bacterium]
MQKILYSLVQFAPDPLSTGGKIVAAVVLFPAESGDGSLRVFQRPAWDSQYHPSPLLDMARTTLEEWDRCDPREATMLFEDIMDSSVGPIQTVETGSCDRAELETLLNRIWTD